MQNEDRLERVKAALDDFLSSCTSAQTQIQNRNERARLKSKQRGASITKIEKDAIVHEALPAKVEILQKAISAWVSENEQALKNPSSSASMNWKDMSEKLERASQLAARFCDLRLNFPTPKWSNPRELDRRKPNVVYGRPF